MWLKIIYRNQVSNVNKKSFILKIVYDIFVDRIVF